MEIDQRIDSAIDQRITETSANLISSIEGDARKALSFGEDIRELNLQIKTIESAVEDLKKASEKEPYKQQ